MASAGVSLAGTSSTRDGGSSLNPAPSFICTGVFAYAHGCVFCIPGCVKLQDTQVLWGQMLRWPLLVFISTDLNG